MKINTTKEVFPCITPSGDIKKHTHKGKIMATIPWCILSILLIIYLTCSFIESLVTTIDIKVDGTYVLKSDVRQYSVDGQRKRLFTLRCLLNTEEEPKAVSLLNIHGIAENVTINKRSRFSFEWYTKIQPKSSNEAGQPDRYTCKAMFSLSTPSAVNRSDSYSEIYSEVEIKYVMSEQLTALSVGLIAYTGEEVSVACRGEVEINDKDFCSLESQPQYELIHIPPVNKSGQNESVNYNCGYTTDSCDSSSSKCPCRLHIDVEIWTNLELFLTPSNFSSNSTTLEFNCTSIPPRLLGWTIITDNGDIIDLSSSSNIIKVSMNVTITQKAGESVLHISEASAGGNGILSVICSSYDTPAKVYESSHRVFIDKCSDSDTDTVLSTVSLPFTESPVKTATEIHNKKTTEIFEQKTTVDYDLFHTTEDGLKEVPNLTEICVYQKPNFELCVESIEVRLLLLATALLCSLVVAAVVLGLLRKLWRTFARTTPTTFEEDDKVPSGTVLHDNPVYLSYSETGGSSPVDVVQSDISAYANV